MNSKSDSNGCVITSNGNGNGYRNGKTNGRTRLRRTSSVTRVSDIKLKEKKERALQPDNPCHEPHDSLLSSTSGYTNYRGFLNLCIILLVISNARVALENIIKYGILVDPLQGVRLFIGNPSNWPSVQLVLSANSFILISLCIEKYGFATHLLNELSGRCLIGLNLIGILALPPIVIQHAYCHPIGASIACGIYSIISLKLVSYHHVNYWCRSNREAIRKLSTGTSGLRRRSLTMNDMTNTSGMSNGSVDLEVMPVRESNEKFVSYPDNLNLRDMYYFMFAPTLCYELNFPRSERIRKRFLIKRILEGLFLLQLMIGLTQQWMVPLINNSLNPFIEMNFSKMLERLLKLAIPNHLIWIIFFYWLFHSVSNAVAEILRFADREFYRDWWNSESVEYFWQNWNIPVHKWCVRHFYKPLINRGLTRFQASVAVFSLSAFFHEYLVSVPLSMFRLWAFFGMMSQIPFSMLVGKFNNRQYANMAVWISLIIGQPLCILMYYHDFYIINHLAKQIDEVPHS